MIDKLLNTPESNNEIQNTNHPLCILQSLNCYSQTGNDTKAVILKTLSQKVCKSKKSRSIGLDFLLLNTI